MFNQINFVITQLEFLEAAMAQPALSGFKPDNKTLVQVTALRTGAGSALQAKSYVAPDGLGMAVVVINSGARAEEGALEIPGAEPDGITVHRLDQPVAMPAGGTPVALRLSAYDINVFVVERLRQ
jgi:hypothetical protein